MLHTDDNAINVLKNHEAIPEAGIIVGEAKDAGDLTAWCDKIDGDTLIAGAAEFFTAVLEHLHIKQTPKPKETAMLRLPVLMVCGSTFHKSAEFVKMMLKEGVPVIYMTEDVAKKSSGNKRAFKQWIDETVCYLKQSGKGIIALDPAIKGLDALTLRATMAEATASIAAGIRINEYLVEGGSTSSAIMRKLGIDTLYPVQVLAPGVIRMRVKGKRDLHITVKPGSYSWPACILPPKITEGSYEIDAVQG